MLQWNTDAGATGIPARAGGQQVQVDKRWAYGERCERWPRTAPTSLQSAFFNGVGYEAWENVWGIWNQLTPRDAEALRTSGHDRAARWPAS